jgi:hypothetical protein
VGGERSPATSPSMSNRRASAAPTQGAGRLGVGANPPPSGAGVGVGGWLPPARLEPSKSLQMYLLQPARVQAPPAASSSGVECASARPPLSVAVTPLQVRGVWGAWARAWPVRSARQRPERDGPGQPVACPWPACRAVHNQGGIAAR